MMITPVNFTGKREILNYEKKYGKLTPEEANLRDKAIAFHDVEVYSSCDYDYCSAEDKQKIDEYILALNTFKLQPSKFAYKVAVDSLSAEANAVGRTRHKVKTAAKEIAMITPEVTKTNIFNDWKKLT